MCLVVRIYINTHTTLASAEEKAKGEKKEREAASEAAEKEKLDKKE